MIVRAPQSTNNAQVTALCYCRTGTKLYRDCLASLRPCCNPSCTFRGAETWPVSCPSCPRDKTYASNPLFNELTTFLTDEPRRSGRATKGQYTKDRDIDEDAPKKKGRGKASKTKEPEVHDEENETIRCICGTYEEEEDTERDMICCDNCSAWQHNDCMLLPYPADKAPDKYYCEQCKPEDHKDLLAAIARGEKPWEEVAKRREAALAAKTSKKKKGGKRGRKSASRPSEPVSEATPEGDTTQTPGKDVGSSSAGQKRKHEEPSNGAGPSQVSNSNPMSFLT